MPIIHKIEEIIYNQKFEGAAVGIFNSNIIARDLGLSDKKDIDHRGSLITISVNNKEAKEGLNDVIGEINS